MLPLVISTTVCAGARRPEDSASRMMRRAARSFMLPPGLRNSHLARIRPGPRWMRDSSISGVEPIRSRTDAACIVADMLDERGVPPERSAKWLRRKLGRDAQATGLLRQLHRVAL